VNKPKRQLLKECALFIASLFSYTFGFGGLKSFYIPGFLINHYLAQRFPIEKKWFIFELNFSNPFLDFLSPNQELFLRCEVSLLILNSQPKLGQITLVSSYRYDPDTHYIFLKKPRIAHFHIDGLQDQSEEILQAVSSGIASLFEERPIYEIRDRDIQFFDKAPHKILVEDGGIRFFFN